MNASTARLALVRLDSRLKEFPDDWYARYARGMALAGLGRRGEALRDARSLQQSVIYREDAFIGPGLAINRAQILAQMLRRIGSPGDVIAGHMRVFELARTKVSVANLKPFGRLY